MTTEVMIVRKYVACIFLLLLSLTIEGRNVLISPQESIQDQFVFENTTYIIKNYIDLSGKTICIPNGSTIRFRKNGSLNNGTISGRFKLANIRSNSLNLHFSNCQISGLVPVYKVCDVAGLISSCVDGCTLQDDIIISDPIKLKSGIDGNNHKISCTASAPVALYILDSKKPIEITHVKIVKDIPSGTVNQNYALYIQNSSNITIAESEINGRIQCVNTTKSDETEKVSKNISIVKCSLKADLTECPQGWEYCQDHLAFYSIKNVRIEDCSIDSRNVNRVLKTSAYFSVEDYSHPQNCTDGVSFRCNNIHADSKYGKQFWDMFCGTVNVIAEQNIVNLRGFSRFIENKSFQLKYKGDKILSSLITIKDNSVVMEGGNLFQFMANSTVDNFNISKNSFTLLGSNINHSTQFVRSCAMLLQGYKSCRFNNNNFVMKDDAVGLPLAYVNFKSLDTEIRDNNIQDACRIYITSTNNHSTGKMEYASLDRFVYAGNIKNYTAKYGENSKMEVYCVRSKVRKLTLDMPVKTPSTDFFAEFGNGSCVEGLTVIDNSHKHKKIFINNSLLDSDITIDSLPAGVIQQGNCWIRGADSHPL